jgi:hypothetical protein
MARKVLNRVVLREENDAAERQGIPAAPAEKAAPAKKTPRRKSRAAVAKEVRLKAFWGVFNQSLRRIARFEYSQRKLADQKAKELSESQRTPHFVQLVKEILEE